MRCRMDDLDQVLEALQAMRKAEGAREVSKLLGPELARGAREIASGFEGLGELGGRELVLKTGRLFWQKRSRIEPAPETWDSFGLEFDRISLRRLDEREPALADKLRGLIKAGAKPDQVRRCALIRRVPSGWVDWVESAARAIFAETYF